MLNIREIFQHDRLLSVLRYESPIAPNLHIFQETAVEAFPMAIVGFAVAFSVAKVYSVKHDYTIDGNQVCTDAKMYNIKERSYSSNQDLNNMCFL